jgi:hypothetical protein
VAVLVRKLGLLLVAALGLTACRLDVTVDLVLRDDGTGELVVTAIADAELVQQVPGLAADLRFDDAVAAGWVVDGPTATADGGLTVTLRHAVSSAEEASNLLVSLGPPFVDPRVERTTDGDTTVTQLSGQLTLPGGFAAFADSDLVTAVGGAPFADDLATSGATPSGNLAVRFRAALPGDIEDTTGTRADGAVTWDAPLDGSSIALTTRAEQRPAPGWASIVSTTALVLLVVWLLVVIAGAVAVSRLRRRRAGRRLGPESSRRLEELERIDAS